MFAPLNRSLPAKTTRMRTFFSAWEGIGLALAILVGFHFLSLRIRAGALPAGDEGSWMSVAAELARGQGYTTRWLEAHFLLPYTLPRPDDFRYPALTSILALMFKLFGISVEVARWTVSGIFLGFSLVTYFMSRFSLGRWTAMAGLWLMVCSLFQLEWNSLVFTEGLFGLVLSLLIAWCLWGEASIEKKHTWGFQSFRWWMILGIGVGFLYLVRANGILFLPGIAWLFWLRRKSAISWKHPLLALAAFLLLVSPWLLRSGLHFGNPFHIAGSAGMLREVGHSHTQSFAEYFSKHDFLFPIKRIVLGSIYFLRNLHEFEHGLEAIPLILAGIALVLRRPFYSPFIALGFAMTFIASAYAAYNSWAGNRYMSSLLPFIYIYGLALLPYFAKAKLRVLAFGKKQASRTAMVTGVLPWMIGALAIALLLLPVVNPHRFHERQLSQKLAKTGAYGYRQGLSEHLDKLKAQLPLDSHYYAASLCNVNFLLPGRNCVGLQELYDPAWLPRSMTAFKPNLLILTHDEIKSEPLIRALEQMRTAGYTRDILEKSELAVYFSIGHR